MLKAREELEKLRSYDASNIFQLHYAAFENEEQAKELQNNWLLKEAEVQSRRMRQWRIKNQFPLQRKC